MLAISWFLNVLLFLVVLNISYIKNKHHNNNYPDKAFSKLIIFPLALGTVFTIIVDVFKGFVFYQLILFIIAAILLYWVFYFYKPR